MVFDNLWKNETLASGIYLCTLLTRVQAVGHVMHSQCDLFSFSLLRVKEPWGLIGSLFYLPSTHFHHFFCPWNG